MVVGTGPALGAALAAHPGVDMVSFTGSTVAGRLVGRAAADTVKRVALELGGKSASVLLPDADLPWAVKATVNNAFLNSGQTCTAWTRLLVHRDQHDEAAAPAGQLAKGMASPSSSTDGQPILELWWVSHADLPDKIPTTPPRSAG